MSYMDTFPGEQPSAQKKPKFDIGQFLLSWAGHLGDSLTHNPVYANSLQAQQQAEAEARKEASQRAWWVQQQEYEAAHRAPPSVGDINHYQEAIRLGYIPKDTPYQSFLGNLHPQSPVVLPYNVDPVGGEPQGAAPAPSGGGDIREQAIEAIRQGADPAKVLERLKSLGGPTGQPSGGFPGGY